MQSTLSRAPAPITAAPPGPAAKGMFLHNRIGLAIMMGVLMAVLFGLRFGAGTLNRLSLR